MLIEFKVKNFLSFRGDQTLSLVASPEKNLLTHTFKTKALPNKRLLRSAVVYGANASGKSNLIKALYVVQTLVEQSADWNPSSRLGVRGFLLDGESATRPSEFELTFIHKDVRYQYGFIVDQHRIYEEWLLAYPKLSPQNWFERKWDKSKEEYVWHFGSSLKGEKYKLIPLTRENVLFLSLAAKFNHEQLSIVYEWFIRHLSAIESQEPLTETAQTTLRFLAENPQLYSPLNKLLKIADIGIVDFVLEKEPVNFDREETPPDTGPEELRQILISLTEFFKKQVQTDGIEMLRAFMRHKSAHERGDAIPFQFLDESLGTRKLFELGVLFLGALSDGDVVFVDELDSSLHPNLVRTLVEMFNNPTTNPNNAQLIFNTHDTNLLASDVFRRDQVWFTEKDNNGASHLYSLLDFSPRTTEALEKGYLQGRYGAVPIIGSIEGLFRNDS